MAGNRRSGPPRLEDQHDPWLDYLRTAYTSGVQTRELVAECLRLGMPPRSTAAVYKVVQRLGLKRPEGFVADTGFQNRKPAAPWEDIFRSMYEANKHINDILMEIRLHGAPDSLTKEDANKLIDTRGWRRGPGCSSRDPRPLQSWEQAFREMYTSGVHIDHIVSEVRRLGAPGDINADRLRKRASHHGWRRPPEFFTEHRRNQLISMGFKARSQSTPPAEQARLSEHPTLKRVFVRKTEIMRRIPVPSGKLPYMYGQTKFVPVLPPEIKKEPPPDNLELPPPGPDGVVLAHFLVIKKYATERNYHFDGSNVEQLNRDLRRGLPPIIMRG